MQRTPPPSPPLNPASAVLKSPMQLSLHGSDPNLSAPPPRPLAEASSLPNITTRPPKWKNEDVTKADILDLFAALKEDQDQKFTVILSSINEVRSALEVLPQKYETAQEKIVFLEQDKIQSLENKVETLERICSVEIRSVPLQASKETKDSLKQIVRKAAEALGIPLDCTSNIKDVYRINTNSQAKPIIADFTTVLTRDRFLASFKAFNKEHQSERFNTGSLGIGGPVTPVYFGENLTQKDRKLYSLARTFAKSSGYAFCWISYGRVFLRKAEGSMRIRVACERDLDGLV
ncbi:Zinc finger DNA binding protein [Operophtera brumata]|uniref:Zinc finger DNA binding protein n=1 Tax=Operophtera brumata TaxID=104452 RepID=A0A0L7LCH7_OPEBR|nr:Zinc finger DNA binding protein [Operophtera brumata]